MTTSKSSKNHNLSFCSILLLFNYTCPKELILLTFLRGGAIFLVAWSHTTAPRFGAWGPGTVANILFFFCSGIFFKSTSFLDFIKIKPIQLLIPLLGYYIISIPFRFIVDFWDYRSFEAFDWNRILDLFALEGRSDYLSINVPLWFLLTLFFIQLYSVILFKLPKPVVFATALISLGMKNILLEWPTLFMINNALYWYGFFALGWLFGKPYLSQLTNPKKRISFMIGEAAIFASGMYWLYASNPISEPPINYHIHHLCQIAFIFLMVSLFSFFNGLSKLNFLKFLGTNTLIILGAHLWVLVPVSRIQYMLTRVYSPYYGLMNAAIALALLVPLIVLINKKFPWLAGKGLSPKPLPATTRT